MITNDQFLETINNKGIDSAFILLVSSAATDDGTWMNMLYEINEKVYSEDIANLLKNYGLTIHSMLIGMLH